MYYVYILTNKPYGMFYVGVTNNLVRRIYEHKEKCAEAFTKTYNIDQLVWYEIHEDITEAIKRWKRNFKINIIEKDNPEWKDLYTLLI